MTRQSLLDLWMSLAIPATFIILCVYGVLCLFVLIISLYQMFMIYKGDKKTISAFGELLKDAEKGREK